MASTEQLPSKRWRGLYRDSAGRKRNVSGTFGRKSDAFDAAQDAEVHARRKASAETGYVSAKITWGQWWQLYWSEREHDTETGITERKIHDNMLVGRWGEVPLNHIEHRDVQLWIDQLGKRYASTYVRRIFGVFAASVNAAMKRGILSASPCAGVRRPRAAKQAKSYLSMSEFAAMAPHLPEPYRDAVEFLLETGLRPGELAGLHAHRIDFHRRRAWVSDTYVRRMKAVRGSPKDADARSVPLTTKAEEIVRRRLAERNLRAGCGLRHLDNKRCAHPLVFLNAHGGPMNSEILQRRMRKATDAAGLDAQSPYCARRGYATRLADGGVDTFQIQRLMGHADLEETEGYVQESPAAAARTLEALGETPPKLTVVDDDHNTERHDQTWDTKIERGTNHGTNRGNQGSAVVLSQQDQETP